MSKPHTQSHRILAILIGAVVLGLGHRGVPPVDAQDAVEAVDPDPAADGYQTPPEPEPSPADTAPPAPVVLSPGDRAAQDEANAADDLRQEELYRLGEYADGLAARAAQIEAQRISGVEVLP